MAPTCRIQFKLPPLRNFQMMVKHVKSHSASESGIGRKEENLLLCLRKKFQGRLRSVKMKTLEFKDGSLRGRGQHLCHMKLMMQENLTIRHSYVQLERVVNLSRVSRSMASVPVTNRLIQGKQVTRLIIRSALALLWMKQVTGAELNLAREKGLQIRLGEIVFTNTEVLYLKRTTWFQESHYLQFLLGMGKSQSVSQTNLRCVCRSINFKLASRGVYYSSRH